MIVLRQPDPLITERFTRPYGPLFFINPRKSLEMLLKIRIGL